MSDDGILPKHGNYRDLKAYQNAVIVHDGTCAFCQRFFRPTDRTAEQMIQAARSGKQNIAEGCSVRGTSQTTELKLMGVARARLEELSIDYSDFLRQRGFELWTKDHEKAVFIRKLAIGPNRSFETYRLYIEEKSPETAANTMICLIQQTTYLLDRLKIRLARDLAEEGGNYERIVAARRQFRASKKKGE